MTEGSIFEILGISVAMLVSFFAALVGFFLIFFPNIADITILYFTFEGWNKTAIGIVFLLAGGIAFIKTFQYVIKR